MMIKRLGTLTLIMLILFMLFFALHIFACIFYDAATEFTLPISSSPTDIESYLNKKLWLANAHFGYIGYSTQDTHVPDEPTFFSWYTSDLPPYLTFGAEACMFCLVHSDSSRSEFDYATVYIGSPRAVDSVTLRYAHSFQRFN